MKVCSALPAPTGFRTPPCGFRNPGRVGNRVEFELMHRHLADHVSPSRGVDSHGVTVGGNERAPTGLHGFTRSASMAAAISSRAPATVMG